MKHKKPEKMSPDDTAQINAAREALETAAAQLLSVWEAQQSAQPQK